MSKTGDIVTIKMTDDPDNSDFEYMAHRRGDTQKDMFYIGAYLGYVDNNKLRSLSGKTPAASISQENFNNYAQNNGAPDNNGGSGYNILAWYQSLYLQCMYVLKYKNLNSQATIGVGLVDNGKQLLVTGGTNLKGMDWGDTTAGKQQMKLFGIEDVWGHNCNFITGAQINGSTHLLTATDNFNDFNGSSYVDRGAISTASNWGWVSKILGTTHLGFLCSNRSGSDTTYYCDAQQINNNNVVLNMWMGQHGTWGGMFCLEAAYSYTGSHSELSSRVMYL